MTALHVQGHGIPWPFALPARPLRPRGLGPCRSREDALWRGRPRGERCRGGRRSVVRQAGQQVGQQVGQWAGKEAGKEAGAQAMRAGGVRCCQGAVEWGQSPVEHMVPLVDGSCPGGQQRRPAWIRARVPSIGALSVIEVVVARCPEGVRRVCEGSHHLPCSGCGGRSGTSRVKTISPPSRVMVRVQPSCRARRCATASERV